MSVQDFEYHEGLTDPTDLVMSVESLYYMNADIDAGFDSISTLEDIALGLESIREATATELILAESALRGVTTGLGLEHGSVDIDLASYMGKEVSTESIVAFIKKIWMAIWNTVKRLFKAGLQLAVAVRDSIPMTLRAIENLQKAVEQMSEKDLTLKDTHTQYGDSISMLVIGNTIPDNVTDIKLAMESLNNTWTLLADSWVDKSYLLGQRFIESVERAKVGDIPALLTHSNVLANNIHVNIPTLLAGNVPINAARFGSFHGTYRGEVLLGNKALTVNIDPINTSDPVDEALSLQSLKVTLDSVHTSLNMNSVINSATIKTASLGEIKDLLAETKSMLLDMNSHFHGSRNRQLQRWLKDMGKGMDKLSTRVELQMQASTNANIGKEMQAIMNYVPCFSRWVLDGQSELGVHAIRVARGVGRLSKRMLSNYR